MSERITTDHVAVQVETSRSDVWVPDGLAVERRSYPAEGIAFDAKNGLALTGDGAIVEQDTTSTAWWKCRPIKSKGLQPIFGLIVEDKNISGEGRFLTSVVGDDAVSLGPTIAATKMPVPVTPGQQVRMSGMFRLRGFGEKQTNSNGNHTSIQARVTLWGCGTVTDEYGVTTEKNVVLQTNQWQHYTTTLHPKVQPSFVNYTIPDLGWVTVPANVDSVYLSVSFVGGLGYQSCAYSKTMMNYANVDMTPFASPKINSVTDPPLRIHVREPAGTHPTYPHPLSSTGYAFKDRQVFTNTPPGAEVTVMGAPGGAAVTVSVHEWTGTAAGALLTTLEVPAGQRIVAAVTSPTGALALSSASTFYVESVLAPAVDTLTVEQTHTTRYEYTTVTDPVAQIETKLTEAALGVSTVRFVSPTISEQVTAGKRMRVLGLHSGGSGYTPLVTGTIRGRRLVLDIKRRRQVEISIHDAWPALGTACPVTYDQLHEYGLMVHRLGTQVSIDGVDYTGPAGPLPDGYSYFPSYGSAGQTVRDALLMTRNSRKGYLWIDRRGRLQLTESLPDDVVLEVSDQPDQGDMSYSREFEIVSDTSDLITTVQVVEHMLDRDNYVKDRTVGGDDPPHRFGPITSHTQSIDYRRAAAIDAYGETKKTFPVVRGTGRWEDIRADNFGSDFAVWAAGILDRHAVERDQPAGLFLVVEPQHVAKVAALQPLDAIAIRHDGAAMVLRARSITHEIDAYSGRWLCTVDFTIGRDGVYWLPDPPELADPPVLGGLYNDVGTGSYDGGTPETTGLGIIDGGEL